MKRILLFLLIILNCNQLMAQSKMVYKNCVNSVVTIETDSSQGSGFFVDSNLIVTNYHVIEGASKAYCYTTSSSNYFNIEGYVALDKKLDLVILKVNNLIKPKLILSLETPEPGERIYALGSPKGLPATISDGLVSGLRDVNSTRLLQISAPISHGSSGGPVLNSKGQVIGVSVASLEEGQNLNFAIPSLNVELLLKFKNNFVTPINQLNNLQKVIIDPIKYPIARRTEVVNEYFGQFVYDPYRWMEDDRSAETEQWVKEENSVTDAYLNNIPFRQALKDSMKSLWNFNSYSLPFRAGKSYFYYRQEPNQNQPLLFYIRSLEYVPMSYFDQNKLSTDGTTHFTETTASEDGFHIAFQVSYAGSDWNEIRIIEAKTMKTLPEVLEGIKFSNTAWYQNGFFYSRYDVDTTKAIYTLKNENHKIYYHKLYSEQSQDSLVYEDKEHPLRNFSAAVTEDNKYLLIFSSEATSGNNVMLQDLNNPKKNLTTIVKGFDYDFSYIGTVSGKLLFMTNYKAPQNRLVLIDPKIPIEKNWKDLVPESNESMKDATLALDKLIVHYMKDASSQLMQYDLSGVLKGDINLGSIGTVDGLSGSVKDTNLFISFTNFVSPAVIYRYNVVSCRLFVQYKSQLPYDVNQFETNQIFYTSKDGTKIPMFIVHKKGIQLNGNNPTLLFGYGGFNISKTPEFKPERLVFLMNGGVLAVPCLRGGGEYGSKWHEAGTQLKKQNVFDDFIAAAEYLIANKYTNPSKLAISGRSNGGLLVGAVMLQRPELFKVALPAVGVMDMLRYNKFTIGWSWKGDYGSSDDSVQFKNLIKYSPLHNIKENVEYPCTFVTTGDHDDRVVPAHSFKFAATLQNKYKGERPMLIRIDSNAGHGAGKPKFKLIDEQADIFTFLFYNLGMSL